MSPQDSLHYASLLIDGQRYDTIEFSAAGLSFARAVVEASELNVLQRGDECAATLCLGGEGWREVYSVVLRLAARGPAHLGFAFVALPPAARRLLEQPSVDPEGADPAGSADSSPWGGGPAPFSFARLIECAAPARRFILPESETVFAHTQVRHEENGLRVAPPSEQPPQPRAPSRTGRVKEPSLPFPVVLAYGVALLVVAALCWAVIVA